MKIALGTVGHFGLAVPDPKKSAQWRQSIFDVRKMFESDDYVGIKETIEHVSFHLPDMEALRGALAVLRERGVEVEDPGDEIGPEAKGSRNRACGSTIRTATAGTFQSKQSADLFKILTSKLTFSYAESVLVY